MELTGLHFLLTYRCLFECDHCFVWGSPRQKGTMTLDIVRRILDEAERAGTVEWIYFEGGEPFLYSAILQAGVDDAARRGFQVGIVSNAYWATGVDDALEWLRPFAGKVHDLSISSDLYHGDGPGDPHEVHATKAAAQLGIPLAAIRVAQPVRGESGSARAGGSSPSPSAPPADAPDEARLMYKGRAAEKLAGQAALHPWDSFIECPHENFRDPGRLHVDAYGDLHVCQGITAGNLFERPLREICRTWSPGADPVTGPILRGGPVALVREYGVAHPERCADACHLCTVARRALRTRFPEILRPDQMYGVAEA